MSTNWTVTAGVFGALAIAIGAFGAHGLPTYLDSVGRQPEEVAHRLDTFETGARYHMYAALALLALGIAPTRLDGRLRGVACWLLLIGAVIFSGLIYVIAVADDRFSWLGAVVPLGGLMQIAAWVAIALAAWRAKPAEKAPA